MDGLDAFDQDDSTQEQDGSGASGTYIELTSDKYPEGYKALSQGGPIRGFFRNKDASVKDLFNELVIALGPYFEEGDKMPLLRWLGPDEDDLRAYAEENDDLEVEIAEE